jgi:hypothetical protein
VSRMVLALVLAVALPGCLLVNPPSAHMQGGGLTPVPATQFCAEMARVACTGYLSCCDTATLDMPTCVSSIQSNCAMGFGPIIIDPRTGYSETVAAEVLAEGEALVADCSIDIVAWYSARMGLQRVLQGTVPGGGVCSMSASDVPAYFSCSDLDQGCIGSGMNFACRDRLATGMPCFVAPDCVETDYCMGGAPILGFPGRCAPREAIGAPCGADGDCSTYLCTPMAPRTCAALDQQSAYCGLR